MIKEFKSDSEPIQAGIVYNGLWEQMKQMYLQDKDLGGEFCLSAIELIMTGELSTDNQLIKTMLLTTAPLAEKNRKKYNERIAATRQRDMSKFHLEDVANMYMDGMRQIDIANVLSKKYSENLSQQDIAYRISVLKSKYPDLLKEKQKWQEELN